MLFSIENNFYEVEQKAEKGIVLSKPSSLVDLSNNDFETIKNPDPTLEQDQVIPFEEAGLNMNVIPDSEIDKAPLLTLKITEGPNIGQLIHINACGLADQPGRGRKDGCVLIGSQQYADIEEPYNDIIFEPGENSEIGKRHFLIKYIQEATGYYLRDLGDGNGTFVRLDNPLILKTGYIISFGEFHMFIQIFEDHIEISSRTESKEIGEQKSQQNFSFSKQI